MVQTDRTTRSSPIETQLCLFSSNKTFLIVPSCAVFSLAPPRRNSYTPPPSEVLASDPSMGAFARSHSRSRFSWPPVTTRSDADGAEGEEEEEEEEEKSGDSEMSAVRTMWACGRVTRQAPLLVSHTLLRGRRFQIQF